MTDINTLFSRGCGKMPDRYWYQLNGRSAMENWKEQREHFTTEPEEENEYAVHFIYEVKKK